MALLVDAEGRPIGYELFPGNTFESKALESALRKLEKRFGLRQVIIVADRGINSKLNLKRIDGKKRYGEDVVKEINGLLVKKASDKKLSVAAS